MLSIKPLSNLQYAWAAAKRVVIGIVGAVILLPVLLTTTQVLGPAALLFWPAAYLAIIAVFVGVSIGWVRDAGLPWMFGLLPSLAMLADTRAVGGILRPWAQFDNHYWLFTSKPFVVGLVVVAFLCFLPSRSSPQTSDRRPLPLAAEGFVWLFAIATLLGCFALFEQFGPRRWLLMGRDWAGWIAWPVLTVVAVAPLVFSATAVGLWRDDGCPGARSLWLYAVAGVASFVCLSGLCNTAFVIFAAVDAKAAFDAIRANRAALRALNEYTFIAVLALPLLIALMLRGRTFRGQPAPLAPAQPSDAATVSGPLSKAGA